MAVALAPKIEAPAGTLTCRTCKAAKADIEFSPHRLTKSGRRLDCKSCVKEGRAKAELGAARKSEVRRAKDAESRKRPHRKARNRVSARQWAERNPQARRAYRIARHALEGGKLTKPDCCQANGCDRPAEEMHHYDYNAPLDVIFLCRRDHRRGHARGLIRLKADIPRHLGRMPKQLH